MTTRRWMSVVAVSAVVLGLLVLAYHEANRQVNLVESEYCHDRAKEEKDPVRKAEWVKRAENYDRLVR